MEIILENRDQLDGIMLLLREAVEAGVHTITVIKEKKRTGAQNNALHRYCRLQSKKMCDAGVDQKSLVGKFKAGFTLPVTPYMIKDIIREVGRAMYRKASTSDLTTEELGEVYLLVDKRFAEVTGVSTSWPSNDPPAYE